MTISLLHTIVCDNTGENQPKEFQTVGEKIVTEPEM